MIEVERGGLPIPATHEEAMQELACIEARSRFASLVDRDIRSLGVAFDVYREQYIEAISSIVTLARLALKHHNISKDGSFEASMWRSSRYLDSCSRVVIKGVIGKNRDSAHHRYPHPDYGEINPDQLVDATFSPKVRIPRPRFFEVYTIAGITRDDYPMEAVESNLDLSQTDYPVATYYGDNNPRKYCIVTDKSETTKVEPFALSYSSILPRVYGDYRNNTFLTVLARPEYMDTYLSAAERDRVGEPPMSPLAENDITPDPDQIFDSPGHGDTTPNDLIDFLIQTLPSISETPNWNIPLDLMRPDIARLARLAMIMRVHSTRSVDSRIEKKKVGNRLDWLRQNGTSIQLATYKEMTSNSGSFIASITSKLNKLSDAAAGVGAMAKDLEENTEPLDRQKWHLHVPR